MAPTNAAQEIQGAFTPSNTDGIVLLEPNPVRISDISQRASDLSCSEHGKCTVNKPTSNSCTQLVMNPGEETLSTSELSDRNSRRPRKTKRIKFSPQEEANVRRGVQLFGNSPTRWKDILAHFNFHPSRNAGDLKDKWRNMQRTGDRMLAMPFSSHGYYRMPGSMGLAQHGCAETFNPPPWQIQAVQHQSIPQQQHLQSAQQLQQTLAHQPPLMGYQSMQPAVGQIQGPHWTDFNSSALLQNRPFKQSLPFLNQESRQAVNFEALGGRVDMGSCGSAFGTASGGAVGFSQPSIQNNQQFHYACGPSMMNLAPPNQSTCAQSWPVASQLGFGNACNFGNAQQQGNYAAICPPPPSGYIWNGGPDSNQSAHGYVLPWHQQSYNCSNMPFAQQSVESREPVNFPPPMRMAPTLIGEGRHPSQ